RSLPSGDPPAFPGISRDGIFWIDSCVGIENITDGTTHTFLFGERYHRDPAYDDRQPFVAPGLVPIPKVGRWGWVAGDGSHVTSHAPHRCAHQLPDAYRRRFLRAV